MQFEKDFLEEGYVTGLAVSQRGAGANMSVDVALGVAYVEITNTNLTPSKTYLVRLESDGTVNVPVPAADLTNPRKDIVIAKVTPGNPNASSSNLGTIELVAGTPAGSPSAPAVPSNSTLLATIDVPASDTAIGNAQITDGRTKVQLDSNVLPDLVRTATYEAEVLKKSKAVFTDFVEKTIASGAITVTQVLQTVDTEANAASDDLDTITAQVGAGELIHLKADNTARTVVIKHGTGNIFLADGADFSLDDTEKSLTLIRKGSQWHELARGRGPVTITSGLIALKTTNGDSAQFATATTSETDCPATHRYQFTANSMAAGEVYPFEITGTLERGTTAQTGIIKLYIGTVLLTTLTTFNNGTASTGQYRFEGKLTCRATGGSGTVELILDTFQKDGAAAQVSTFALGIGTFTVDTTIANDLKVTCQFNGTTGSPNAVITHLDVYKLPDA